MPFWGHFSPKKACWVREEEYAKALELAGVSGGFIDRPKRLRDGC
jgi:hypothetical protein